ncbi:MAG: hypothetical protein JWQ29_1082 [Phenylobacterium sp.]|nr:hypothetical protein [Phenylobacterium sp.]
MPITSDAPLTLASKRYAVLRYEGVPPPGVRAALDLPEATALRLEELFQARPGGGDDSMRPRFARHAAHVAAVMDEGGYPVLPDPCRPRPRP